MRIMRIINCIEDGMNEIVANYEMRVMMMMMMMTILMITQLIDLKTALMTCKRRCFWKVEATDNNQSCVGHIN